MKTLTCLFSIILTSGLLFAFIGCKDDDNNTNDDNETLTEQEESDLFLLREEEKLARDVYLYFHEKYGLSISKNIANSEQTRLNQVLEILTAYELNDLASRDTGVFNST